MVASSFAAAAPQAPDATRSTCASKSNAKPTKLRPCKKPWPSFSNGMDESRRARFERPRMLASSSAGEHSILAGGGRKPAGLIGHPSRTTWQWARFCALDGKLRGKCGRGRKQQPNKLVVAAMPGWQLGGLSAADAAFGRTGRQDHSVALGARAHVTSRYRFASGGSRGRRPGTSDNRSPRSQYDACHPRPHGCGRCRED